MSESTLDDLESWERRAKRLEDEMALMRTYIEKLEWAAITIREHTPNPERYLTDVEDWIKRYPKNNRPDFVRYQPLSEALSDKQMTLSEFWKQMKQELGI